MRGQSMSLRALARTIGDKYGTGGEWVHLCNAAMSELDLPSPKTNVLKSTDFANFGTAVDAMSVAGEAAFTIKADTFSPLALAILYGSTGTAISVTGTTLATPITKKLVKDEWVALNHAFVSAVTIADLVEGTDFKVLSEFGFIMALTDGAVGDKSITYTHKSITEGVEWGLRASGGVRVELKMLQLIRNTGEYQESHIYDVTLFPVGKMPLVTADAGFMQIEYKGTPIAPAGSFDIGKVRKIGK